MGRFLRDLVDCDCDCELRRGYLGFYSLVSLVVVCRRPRKLTAESKGVIVGEGHFSPTWLGGGQMERQYSNGIGCPYRAKQSLQIAASLPEDSTLASPRFGEIRGTGGSRQRKRALALKPETRPRWKTRIHAPVMRSKLKDIASYECSCECSARQSLAHRRVSLTSIEPTLNRDGRSWSYASLVSGLTSSISRSRKANCIRGRSRRPNELHPARFLGGGSRAFPRLTLVLPACSDTSRVPRVSELNSTGIAFVLLTYPYHSHRYPCGSVIPRVS